MRELKDKELEQVSGAGPNDPNNNVGGGSGGSGPGDKNDPFNGPKKVGPEN
jgi:hypothetical protein